MRKTVSVALALLLLIGLSSAAVAEDVSEYRANTLAAVIQGAFDSSGYVYEYDEENEMITTNFSLDSTLEGTDVEIHLYADGFLVKAYASIYAAPEYLLLTSEYLGRANTGFLVGDFEMDYDTGEIWYKTYQIAEDSFPGYADVLRALETSVNMLDVYGNGLAKVALTGYDPATAVSEAEGEY